MQKLIYRSNLLPVRSAKSHDRQEDPQKTAVRSLLSGIY